MSSSGAETVNFSLLMSIYGGEKSAFFVEAVKSILKSTVLPTEVVLVVDGPISEELNSIVVSLEGTPQFSTKVIRLQKNKGLTNALNLGLKSCKYDLVARFDTDDIIFPDRFEKQIQEFKNQDVDILGTNVIEFNEFGDEQLKEMPGEIYKGFFCRYLIRNPINHPTVMFKKQVIENLGGYLEMAFFEDYYLWLRAVKKGYRIKNLQVPLLKFRRNSNFFGRRSGLQYLKHEVHFYKSCFREGLLPLYILPLVLMRMSLRLLPTRFVRAAYSLSRK